MGNKGFADVYTIFYLVLDVAVQWLILRVRERWLIMIYEFCNFDYFYDNYIFCEMKVREKSIR